MKSRSCVLILILVFAGLSVNAQYKAPTTSSSSSNGSSFSDRIYFGGGGGLSGGSQYLNVSLSPLVGYKITDAFSAGMQITYQYVKSNNLSMNNFGGGPFANYIIANRFIIYSQYEYMSYEVFDNYGETYRLDGRSLFLGIGWNEPLTDQVSFQILGLYDVLYGSGANSPYSSPLQIRAGLVVGF